MDYIYGVALLFATYALFAVARTIYRSRAAKLGKTSFGAAEAMALFLTTTGAAGIAEFMKAVAANWSPAGAAEAAAALTVLIVASIAAHRAIARVFAGSEAADRLVNPPENVANQNRPDAPDRIRVA